MEDAACSRTLSELASRLKPRGSRPAFAVDGLRRRELFPLHLNATVIAIDATLQHLNFSAMLLCSKLYPGNTIRALAGA